MPQQWFSYRNPHRDSATDKRSPAASLRHAGKQSVLRDVDHSARAIRCARAIQEAVANLGVTIRAALHTEECELMDDKVSGIALHIVARVMGQAGPGDVLVSCTVKDLLTGKKPPRKNPVITDKCTACGECESICPKDTVKVKGRMAEVTYSKCIRCFCCHEVCPEDAIVLRSVKLN